MAPPPPQKINTLTTHTRTTVNVQEAHILEGNIVILHAGVSLSFETWWVIRASD